MKHYYTAEEIATKRFFFGLDDLERVINKCLEAKFGDLALSEAPKEDEVLSIKDAVKLIHLSESTIRKHTKAGTLKKLYPNVRKNLYLRADLLNFRQYYNKK